ncbi:Zinc finger protein [Halotydeus destructor]|nr:Zinc finger protein [Halotydeus destructor]
MIDPSMFLEDSFREDDEDSEFMDWKEGFMETSVNMLPIGDYYSDDIVEPTPKKKRIRKSKPKVNNEPDESVPLNTPTSSRPTSPSDGQANTTGDSELAPTRIRRQYTCEHCSFRTINPREFLYHRRDAHGEKVKIVECQYCIYACQYMQKLQRHILLVHKIDTTSATKKKKEEDKPKSLLETSLQRGSDEAKKKVNCAMGNLVASIKIPSSLIQGSQEEVYTKKESSSNGFSVEFENQLVIDESVQDEGQSEDSPKEQSNGVTTNDSKTFKCAECGYSTNTQYLYKKHVKYHTAPKIKCEMCDFESPYSWNVERHARSHTMNGAFSCSKCTFSCETQQALTVHVTKHHRDGDDSMQSPTPSMINEHSNEDIIITPDIGFTMSLGQGSNSSQYDDTSDTYYNQPGLQPNVPYFSSVTEMSKPKSSPESIPVTPEKEVKLLHCAYCSFTHKESKSMVSHMSVHTGKKPYRCKPCGFSSNWKEVVARHAKSRHDGSNADVEQLFKYTVNKFICRVIDETGELNLGPEVTQAEDVIRLRQASLASNQSLAKKTTNNALIDHESMICPIPPTEDLLDNRLLDGDGNEVASRLSGLRGNFKCEHCPFRGEKPFHIDFHIKRHKQQPGADFKCPFCPYWVNAKKSLVRHIYLHEYEKGNLTMEVGSELFADQNEFSDPGERQNPEMSSLKQLLQNPKKSPSRSAAPSKNRCDSCPFTAGTKTQLLYHKQFHRPNRAAPYKCSLCSYSVSHQHLLNQHFKVHNRDSPPVLQLNSADKVGISDEVAATGEQDEIAFSLVANGGGSPQKIYHCRHCPTSSKRRTYIVVHEQMHTMNSAESFKCSSCDYTTQNSTLFMNHLTSHTLNKKNGGQNSSARLYSDVDNADNHSNQSSHSGSLGEIVDEDISEFDPNHYETEVAKTGKRRMFSYVCKDCPAAFKSPGDLKIHVVFHADFKFPFECSYCSYKAKNRPQLQKHCFVHTVDYIRKRADSYPEGTMLTTVRRQTLEGSQM